MAIDPYAEERTMAKRQKTVFAEYNGKLYVTVRAVMHPLIPYVDGLPLVFFPKDKKAYLEVDVAIKWCREEMRHHDTGKYQTMIEVMEKVKEETKAQLAQEDAAKAKDAHAQEES